MKDVLHFAHYLQRAESFSNREQTFCHYDHIKENNPLKLTFCIILGVAKKRKILRLLSSQEATLGRLHSELLWAQQSKIEKFAVISKSNLWNLKKQPSENNISQYFERNEDRFWTYATKNEDSRLTTANTRSNASTQKNK